MSTTSSFEQCKITALGKRDKSFAGRIDVRAVDICGLINTREEYYTLSSCSGRCFIYEGDGVKSTTSFKRYRISHDLIHDARRYFNLNTLEEDPTGGADPIRSIGQYDYFGSSNDDEEKSQNNNSYNDNAERKSEEEISTTTCHESSGSSSFSPLWLRMEPFILHVACSSLTVAKTLMSTARPSFKNVGITSLSSKKIVVAIWGDEGLELPLTSPGKKKKLIYEGEEDWLQELVNQRLERNWSKIERFVNAMRGLPPSEEINIDQEGVLNTAMKSPKSYDVIGDIALLHNLPDKGEHFNEEAYNDHLQKLGEAVLDKNKGINLCAARTAPLIGSERSATKSIKRLASRHANRLLEARPLITTHVEYGVPCVVNVEHCFFSPRMGKERLRLTNSVARGEHVLVLFAGVCMEALQFAFRTEASRVVAMEKNSIAIDCAKKSIRMLQKRKNNNKKFCLELVEGDVLILIPKLLKPHSFDRIVAPRPKEISSSKREGDLGDGTAGSEFLSALLPILKPEGGECHWYDFVADHEFPACTRTRNLIECICHQIGLQKPQFIHTARVGSVAKRQYRVCVDFRLCGIMS